MILLVFEPKQALSIIIATKYLIAKNNTNIRDGAWSTVI